jgi:hypothetical protein
MGTQGQGVILKIIWRKKFEDYLARASSRACVSVKRSMSGHPQNVRHSGAEDAKPDKMIVGRESGPAPSCRRNLRGRRHIGLKEHRQLMFKITGGHSPFEAS